MRPQQVLHEQAALIDFITSAPYEAYLERFFDDMQRKGKVGQHPAKIGGVEVPWGAFISDQVARGLKISQAFHVTPEMMPLLKVGAYDLEDTDYLVHERIPAEAGFLVFEDGWTMTDTWGKPFVINAMHWRHGSASINEFKQSKAVPGIWVFCFNDINDTRDERTAEYMAQPGGEEELRLIGKMHLDHFFFIAYEQRVGPAEVIPDEDYARFATGDLTLTKAASNTVRAVVALFRMLNQVIVEVRDEPLTRHDKKMAIRKNLPARVQTIKLRRKEIIRPPGEEGHSLVEWQHQWVVKGGWQWRACSERHPLAEPYEKGWHARVYIAPYWKGPADRPVLITDKVWSLAR